MNIEKLQQLKTLFKQEEEFNAILKDKRVLFDEENKDLLTRIEETREGITLCKEILTENAKAGFEKDGEKKRLGGVGIRITTKLIYNEGDALLWAKDNMSVAIKTILDKKMFEGYAKTNELIFVDKKDTTLVTFPKEIVLPEE